MATGLTANPDHTDMTNYYLEMGVLGGLVMMILFIAILAAAFSAVGKALDSHQEAPVEDQFLIWTLGAILFGHAVTFFSISYFDQTVVFLYLILAAIGSLRAGYEPVTAAEANESGGFPNAPHADLNETDPVSPQSI
jgi:O-antigen ligase